MLPSVRSLNALSATLATFTWFLVGAQADLMCAPELHHVAISVAS